MARGKRYKLAASTGNHSGWFYWLLVLLIAGGILWVWQKTSHRAPSPKSEARTAASKAAPAATPAATPQVTRTPLVNPDPAHPSGTLFRTPQNLFEAQLALSRLGISAGSIDGVMGSQTRAAFLAFQQSERLPLTGTLDDATRSRLLVDNHPIVSYWVSSNDLARLQPVAPTWLGKSQQSALEYETMLELIAEQSHANPKFILALNPGVNWSNILAGTELRVPRAAYPDPVEMAARIRISLSGKSLQAFGVQSNLLAHFPCSIAQRVEKRPLGELRVAAIAPNPNYTFNPEVFPESPEAQTIGRKLILPPGPNNPVGVAWISLDRPGYGIHGTPGPEQVGRTESHGCFRLANWNAEHLLKLVSVGTPVFVEP